MIIEIIRRLKELDLGMSVTIEGPTTDIIEMSNEMGIKPHSVNLSLDIWGKKEDLPSEEILEFVRSSPFYRALSTIGYGTENFIMEKHQLAKKYIDLGKTEEALKLLMFEGD